MTTTVVIVDDHAGFRTVARALLTSGGFDVTGEAATGEAALETIGELHPDVVLLDVQLPGIDGFEVAQRLADLPDSPAVVMTSTRTRSSYTDRLARCPVHGFITKEDLTPRGIADLVAQH